MIHSPTVKPADGLLQVVVQVHHEVPRDLALIRVVEVHSEHVPLEIVEKIELREKLLVAVGVREARLHHEEVVGSTDPVHARDRPVEQVVLHKRYESM